MPELADPVLVAIPFFVLFTAAEMIHAHRSGGARFEVRDTATSLLMGVGNVASGLLFGGIVGAWFAWLAPHGLIDVPWAWWAWILCFVLDDFVYYWSHRFAHRVRWFWADHVVHHSSQHYNLTTALRQPWTGLFTLKFVLIGSWQVLLGFPPAMIAFCSGLNLVYQFWIHTESIGRLPAWFEAVMNTPSHHRVHHGTNPRYLDRNYAGVFIVWDRLFGTFEAEQADEPVRYGIVRNLATFNPLQVATHEWRSIFRDVSSARSPRELWGYVAGRPGWSPDGSRDTSETLRARWQAARCGGPAAGAAAAGEVGRQGRGAATGAPGPAATRGSDSPLGA
jgi:sterol desaturase/sphingolipid hydroxylase (fatty acid hydroxylase superfamily)